ncbi:glycoside hydrolase family 43 protein, partial [Periconia macrospinosa]
YPDPEPCRGNCSWIHDPSIVKHGNRYYRFSTSGNIAIATAPEIGGPWVYEGAVLTNGTGIVVDEDRQDVWAPNVAKIGDIYYCYYSVSFLGSQESQIGVATSTSLLPGTWTDHGSIHLPKSPTYNLIDPSTFQETPTSPIYLTFGSYWHGIFHAKLATDNLIDFRATSNIPPHNNPSRKHKHHFHPSKPSHIPASQPPITNLVHDSTSDAEVIEGATLHKFTRNDFYYLFFSAGNCCATPPNLPTPGREYRMLVCRGESAMGPFYDKEGRACGKRKWGSAGGTMVLESHGDVYAPGGQGVVEEEGRLVVYYHYG